MNFETLEKTWGKQTVTGTAVPVEKVIARLKTEVRDAQRRFRGAMVIAVGLLALGWAGAIAAHFAGIKRFTPLGFTGSLVDSVFYLALLMRATQGARAAQREMNQMSGTLLASTAATLRTVELRIQNSRIAAYVIALVWPAISTWGILAKYFAGEFPRSGVLWSVAFVSSIGAMIGAAIWYHYRTKLAPRRAELRETLHLLESEAAAPADR